MEEQTLRMEIPGCVFAKVDTFDPEWTDLTSANGWKAVPLGGAPSLVVGWEGTIDLSGYARDYKTFYPEGGVIQEGPYYYGVQGVGQIVSTVVSSVPISLEEYAIGLAALYTPGQIPLPVTGFNSVSQNWETTLFCETQVNLIDSNLPATGFCLPVSKNQTGSLSPTAAQVLYVYKIVIPLNLAGSSGVSVGVPASRVVLPGKMDQEPELSYMMRLSRSIELANQV